MKNQRVGEGKTAGEEGFPGPNIRKRLQWASGFAGADAPVFGSVGGQPRLAGWGRRIRRSNASR